MAAASALMLVHAFMYMWYGTPAVDGRWVHWNHEQLPHWSAAQRDNFPHGPESAFSPPDDIHAPFYPARGLYSSSNATVLLHQLQELRELASVGVVVVSWWGRPGQPGRTDTQGVSSSEEQFHALLAAAEQAGVKVAWHLEPYAGRTVESIAADLAYLADTFWQSPAVARHDGRPIIYVYDAYLLKASQWSRLLSKRGDHSVRGGPHDACFIMLLLKKTDMLLGEMGDGLYTYFGNTGMSYGSNPNNWPALSQWARSKGKLWVPSVSPGYDDSGVRPWNTARTVARENGAYYNRMWSAALASRPSIVSITSFNEWGEGTQIEPAVPRTTPAGRVYSDYAPEEPTFYLKLTSDWAQKLYEQRKQDGLHEEL
eukprot:PLAT15360.1.p1 GENE.PLAT15360.1~~PLAT15360.1.p1  ORF type:complete len:370 (-),score=99.03 PLAT15360.1:73-1182(-)